MKLKLYIYIIFLSLLSCNKSSIDKNQLKLLEDINLFSGDLFRVENFKSIFVSERNVDIWIPDSYNTKKSYSVFYMHDGQSLFDASKTWNNQEWKVDEWSTKLMNTNSVKDFIVVGIHNGVESRWYDYFPQKSLEFMPNINLSNIIKDESKLNSDNYLKFIVKELKPFIDDNFSTSKNAKNTLIGGSSMGGLISMYAVFEYPEIFGSAACLSTHWLGHLDIANRDVFSKAIFDYMSFNIPVNNTNKFYFDYGTETLDSYYLEYAPIVDSIFYSNGYNELNFVNLKFENENHSENSWSKRLNVPIEFLLKK